jgi:hypothetical protein
VSVTVPGKAGKLTGCSAALSSRAASTTKAIRACSTTYSANTQLRLAANNLLGDDYLNARTVAGNGLAQSAFASARTDNTLSVKLEMKL